MDMIIILEFK